MNLQEKLAQFKFKTDIEIRFSDMDMLGHANNAIYLTYFEQARLAYWRELLDWDWKKHSIVIAKSEVEYLKPILLNEKISIYIRTSLIGNSSFETEYAIVSELNGELTLKSTGKTKQVVISMETLRPTRIPQFARDKMIAFDNPEL